MQMDLALIGAGGALAVILALAFFLPVGRAFYRELRYINMKMDNSRHEGERRYWEKRKKSLWRSLLPFCHYDDGHHHHKDD